MGAHFKRRVYIHVNDSPVKMIPTCWRSRPPWATEYIGWGAYSDASNTYKHTAKHRSGNMYLITNISSDISPDIQRQSLGIMISKSKSESFHGKSDSY